jgi:hypothetical protein
LAEAAAASAAEAEAAAAAAGADAGAESSEAAADEAAAAAESADADAEAGETPSAEADTSESEASGDESESEGGDEESSDSTAGDNHDVELAKEVADDVQLASGDLVTQSAEAVGEAETVQASMADTAEISDAQDDLASIGMTSDPSDEGNAESTSEGGPSGDDEEDLAATE